MENDKSILNSIKKLLGMTVDYNPFDADIITHINTVFSSLAQMGIGPANGFSIEDSSSTWDEYTEEENVKSIVKTYMFLKVRLLFDPPTISTVTDSINNQLKELEYRLYTLKGGY